MRTDLLLRPKVAIGETAVFGTSVTTLHTKKQFIKVTQNPKSQRKAASCYYTEAATA